MRLVDRVATLLLALLLTVGGVLLAVEAALVALHRPALLVDRDGWYAALAGTPVDDPVVRATAIVVTAVGLLVLVAQLVRWRPERIRTRPGPAWHLARRSVERRLTGAVTAVPGVSRGRARLVRTSTGWRPRIRVVGDPPTPAAVESAARQELDRLGAPFDDLRVDLRRTR